MDESQQQVSVGNLKNKYLICYNKLTYTNTK